MAVIKKKKDKALPAVNTSALPDIVFMLLFFFMVATVMREVDLKVTVNKPQATEIQKLERKSAAVVDDLWAAGIRSYHCTARTKIAAREGSVEERLGFGDYWSLDTKKIDNLNSALWCKLI